MQTKDLTRLAAVAGSAVVSGAALAADQPQVDAEAVDKAFEALKTYDWGADRNLMKPIDDAVIATQEDAAGRTELEKRLLESLASGVSRSAQDYILRTLKTMGSAQSVPALAPMLEKEDVSHMARYALERIQAPEAAAALRDALPKVKGKLKVGVIGSLGVRGDAESVKALGGLLGDSDQAVATTAAHALGLIGTADAGKALGAAAKNAPDGAKPAIADACLACGEALLSSGNKAEAVLLFKAVSGADQPKHVRFAATQGLLNAAGQ